MPNYQLHLCGPPNPHPHLPAEGMPWSISFCIKCVGKSVTYRICPQWCTDSLDLSLTHGQVPDSLFEGYPPNGAGAIHAAPIRWGHHNAVPWEDTNPQMELTVIEDHNRVSLSQNIHGVPSPSDLLESSPPMIADDFSSLYGGSYTSSEVQDSCADVTSSPGEARSTTRPVETHRQDATTQEASQQSQQPSTKKQKDKVRKRVQRSEDCQHFTKICTLLKIPPGPKKALAYRSKCFISILGQDIDYIIVLVGVQALVERQEHDSDLQRQLEESEAEVAALREDLARVSAERTTGSRLGIKAGTALGGLDTDAIRQ